MRILLTLCCCLGWLATARAQFTEHTLTPADKVYGLSQFWQEVNYNFAFFHQVPHLHWDSAYRAFIPQVLATTTDYDYFRTLQRFCALLQDGHTNVYLPRAMQEKLYGRSFGPYQLRLGEFNHRAYVVNTGAATQSEIPLGSEIVEVNGLPTRQYLQDSIFPYISTSTDFIRWDWGIWDLLKGPAGSKVAIALRTPAGELRRFDLVRELCTDGWARPLAEAGLVQFKWLNDDLAYLAINSFGDPALDSLFLDILPELRRSKGIVIDIRRNGGGDSRHAAQVVKYLTTADSLYGSSWKTRQHRAAFKAWGKFVSPADTLGNPDAREVWDYAHGQVWYQGDLSVEANDLQLPRLTQPVAVLTSYQTASAAEDFLIYLDVLNRAVRIGQPTFGSTGQPLMFELPGGAQARVCTKMDTYPDGREFVGYGIAPHLPVAPTIDDFLQNRDPVLDRATAYLTELLAAGGK